jgi:hypothetical protein
MKVIVFLFGLISSGCLLAQTSYDYILLKKGYILKGSVIEFGNNGNVKFVSHTGGTFNFPQKLIKEIYQDSNFLDSKNLFKPKYLRDTNAFYSSIRLNMMYGVNLASESSGGYSIQYALGLNFAKNIQVGLGIGLDNINSGIGVGNIFYPVFADGIYNFGKYSHGYFIKLNLGYAFSTNDEGQQNSFFNTITKVNNGFVGQLGFGLRMGNHTNIELGYRLQKFGYEWISFDGNTNGINTETYRRWVIGLHFNI